MPQVVGVGVMEVGNSMPLSLNSTRKKKERKKDTHKKQFKMGMSPKKTYKW